MALNLLGQALFWLASSFALKLLTPKVRGPSSGATDPSVDVTGNEGDPIPVVFGTCRVQPKVTWWGDVKKTPNKEQVQAAGIFNIAHYVTVSENHHVGMQMIICMGPIDELIDIIVDSDVSVGDQAQSRRLLTVIPSFIPGRNDTPVFGPLQDPITPSVPITNPGTNVPTLLDVFAPDVLGGEKSGGGIDGPFRFYWGNDPQDANAYLAGKISVDPDAILNTGLIVTMPQWNRVCYAVSEQANMGESPNMRPLQFVVKRCPKILSTTAEGIALNLDSLPYYDLNGDANPAEVILEILLDPIYGVGVTANYDLAAFASAAYYLYREDMGISASLQRKGSAKDFIEEVLRHIDGIITQDPLTGLIGLKLQRPYDDPVTQTFLVTEATATEDNCRVQEVVYPAYRANVNEVKVTFTNRGRMFQQDVAQAQELALMEMANGDIVSETYDYPMFTSHALAQQRAFRLLRQLRGPYQVRFIANRSFAHIGSGSLILVDLPLHRIFNMRFRVAKVDMGTLMDGDIEIEAVEDVFAAVPAPYAAPPGSGGNPPVFTAGHKTPKVTVFQSQNFPAGTVIPGYGVDPGGTIGLLELSLRDPSLVITDVEFWKATGHDPETGPVAFNVANIWTQMASEFVVLDPVFESTIRWRVTYTDQYGLPATIEGIATFGKTDALTVTDVTIQAFIVDFGDSGNPAVGCGGFQRLWNVQLVVNPIYPAMHYRWTPDGSPPVSQSTVELEPQDGGGYTLGGIDELVFAANQDTINCREVPPFSVQIGVITSNQYDEVSPTMSVFNIAYDGNGGFLIEQVPIGTPHTNVTGILPDPTPGVVFLGTPITLNPADPVGTLATLDEGPTQWEGVDVTAIDFLVKTASPKLSAERVVTDTSTVEWDWATAGQAKAKIVAGSVGPTELASTAVTPGTYGDADNIPVITVDADGRVTAASEVTPNNQATFQTLTDGTTVTWTVTNKPADVATVTLGGNRTLAISGAAAGYCGILIVKQDGTGSRTLTLPSGSKVRDTGAGAITLTAAVNAVDVLGWVYDGTNYWWTYSVSFT